MHRKPLSTYPIITNLKKGKIPGLSRERSCLIKEIYNMPGVVYRDLSGDGKGISPD